MYHPISRDHRYTISREQSTFIVRFNGQRIGASRFYTSAVMLAVGDHAIRNGAEIVTEQT